MKEATMGQVEPTEEKAHQMISSFLSGEGHYLVHADKDNILQGWIGIGKTLDFYTGEMVGIIPEIFVLPTYRKQGIAEKLCKQALSHLKQRDIKKYNYMYSRVTMQNIFIKKSVFGKCLP